jgi:hypothetical protein
MLGDLSVEILEERRELLGVFAEARHEKGEPYGRLLHGLQLRAGLLDGLVCDAGHGVAVYRF